MKFRWSMVSLQKTSCTSDDRWVGKNKDDEDKIWLNIVSEDKKIVLVYRVGEGDFFIVSKGCMFQSKETSGSRERYWYPIKEPPMVITPKFVYELIAWAVDEKDVIILNR